MYLLHAHRPSGLLTHAHVGPGSLCIPIRTWEIRPHSDSPDSSPGLQSPPPSLPCTPSLFSLPDTLSTCGTLSPCLGASSCGPRSPAPRRGAVSSSLLGLQRPVLIPVGQPLAHLAGILGVGGSHLEEEWSGRASVECISGLTRLGCCPRRAGPPGSRKG